MKRHLACLILLCAVTSVPLSRAQAPATTIVSDVIYRGDGTPAGGTLLITWPAFATASGKAVAAGQKSVSIGAGGAVNVALVPNEGASPSGTYYKVVYKLDDGSTSEELWSLPNVPTTTIAAIRSTVVPSGVAIQVASKQYVDTQLAAVAGTRFHNVRYCDQFGGTDAGARITACIADLPLAGGVADARGLEGAQTISSTITISKPVQLLLGQATYSCTATGTCFLIDSNGVSIIGTAVATAKGTELNFNRSGYSNPATARDARGAIEFTLVSGGTLVPTRTRIENLAISTRNGSAPNTTPGDVCIKFRASYSMLRNIACSIDGDGATDPPASGILFLGDQANGNGSYYNLFDTITVGGRATSTGVTDEVCLRFDTDTVAGTRFPNANTILGGGQMISCSTGIWVRGSGNNFYGVVAQSNTAFHWRFGVTGSMDTNEGNVFGAFVEGGAASTAFQFETSAKNNRILPSVVTGVLNRFVDNAVNGRNLLYELSHSGVSSGSPQYGWGFDSASTQSRYYNNEVVSHAFGGGSFIVGGGNGIHFADTATTASSANCALTGGAGFFQAHRGAGGDCAVRKYFNRTDDTNYQNRLSITGAAGNISFLAESGAGPGAADANVDFTFTPKG
ncbi:MAG: hypothetical protein ACRD2Q_06440, partial [Terriglobales bacterium]